MFIGALETKADEESTVKFEVASINIGSFVVCACFTPYIGPTSLSVLFLFSSFAADNFENANLLHHEDSFLMVLILHMMKERH